MGVYSKNYQNKGTKGIRFVYLIYNPQRVKDNIEKYRKEILSIYQETIKEIEQMGGMRWLFELVWEFQEQNIDKKGEAPSFEFVLTDQDGYKDAVEK